MTEPDLQELAELWQEPDASGAQDVQRLARRARRDARIMSWADTAFGIVIVGGALVGALMKPSVPVAIGAMLSIVLTLWINWKRKLLRQISKTLVAGGRDDFLDASVRLAKTGLRRVTLSLIAFPPGILAALLYKVGTKDGIDHPLVAIAQWATTLRGMFALAVVAAIALWMLRSRRRYQSELRRLEEVRQAYADEALQDQKDGA